MAINWFVYRITFSPLSIGGKVFEKVNNVYLFHDGVYPITVTDATLLYPAFVECCNDMNVKPENVMMAELLGRAFDFESSVLV